MIFDMKVLLRISMMVVLVIQVTSQGVAGQVRPAGDKAMRKAREAWERRDYREAESAAGKLLRADSVHREALLLMADIRHEVGDLAGELSWLRKAAAAGAGGSLLDFRLGEALYRNGVFEEALVALDRFMITSPRGNLLLRATTLKEKASFAAWAVRNPVPFQPEDPGPGINTPLDEYWPSLTVDAASLLFTRRVPVAVASDGRWPAPKGVQEDFYMSRRDSGHWATALPLTELNSPANEGAASVSADGRILFFTLCNHPEGYGSCDIWFSRLEEKGWTPPRNAGEPVNTPGWEGQPSLSAFGDQLWFSSERAGTKGKKDLWMVPLQGWTAEGMPLWGGVVNGGDSLNTPGDEISPFLHPGGRDLFFASDGWPGMGGYDLFRAVLLPAGTWSAPSNLGYPVNTTGNEQGLVTDRTGVHAWLATGKTPGGDMDLFSFQINAADRPSPVTYIRGKVTDDSTSVAVAARVQIRGEPTRSFPGTEVTSDTQGSFLVALPLGEELLFSVDHPGYLFYSERFRFDASAGAPDPLEREIRLKPAHPGTTINLYQIYFATDQYEVLPASAPELNLLLGFLRSNPALRVEIGGHTDNTGSEAWNLQLSEKRAASVRDYLVSRGLEAQRLTSRGYGMGHPVAPNDTEEGRAKNRRTSITILP